VSAVRCPHCGNYWVQEAAPPRSQVEIWREECRKKGYYLAPGDCVSEAVAAELVERAPGTLANRRRDRTGPPARKMGVRGSRYSYRLCDLADWLRRE